MIQAFSRSPFISGEFKRNIFMADTITGIIKRIKKQQYVIRTAERSYRPGPAEVMVQPDLIRGHDLREGIIVTGQFERKKGKRKLVSIESIGAVSYTHLTLPTSDLV